MNLIRRLYNDYLSEIIFGFVLTALMVFSYWGAAFIPVNIFEYFINPAQYIVTITVCFYGAWMMFRHHEGNKLRISWAWVLVIWGIIDTLMLVLRYGFEITAVGGTPDDPLYNASLTVGNILAWMLFIYPSQVLRPGWLKWWKAVLIVSPLVILGVIDYFLPVNLLHLIMIYPAVIFFLLCSHVRKYRQWCEDNYSSMDDIDVQWIVRYLTMLFLAGLAFYFICFWFVPNRMFTQLWTLCLILAYSTEQILYRKNPWDEVQYDEAYKSENAEVLLPEDITLLKSWIETEKPYFNPDFKLQDLKTIIPKNRTYLSQLVKATYGVSFYQIVGHYRIVEAQKILKEHPDIKFTDVATHCGFSSSTVFSRTFSRETGLSPRLWLQQALAEK